MINAIITQLKTGTYKNVYTTNDGQTNLLPPYVMIWESTNAAQIPGQALGGIFVSLHVLPGQKDLINNYLKNETLTLLHQIQLTDSFGNKFRLEASMDLSTLVSNDDGTISKDRLFTLPVLGFI